MHRFPLKRKSKSAFSLVEVVIALGVVSFVIVGLLGLMSVGIGGIRNATDDSVSASIGKKMVSEMQQNTLSNLLSAPSFPVRWFNAEGQEVPQTDPFAVYKAQAVVTNPNLAGISSANMIGQITINIYRNTETTPSTVWISYAAKN